MGGLGEEEVVAVVAHAAQIDEVVHVAERSVIEIESLCVDHVQVIRLSGTNRNVKHGHYDSRRINTLGPRSITCDFSIPASAFASV